MKIKEITCALGDHFMDANGRKVLRLLSANGLQMDLVPELSAVRVDDPKTGTYYVPLARILRFYPLEEPKAVKKAANQ